VAIMNLKGVSVASETVVATYEGDSQSCLGMFQKFSKSVQSTVFASVTVRMRS
jgi:hypothetical protein